MLELILPGAFVAAFAVAIHFASIEYKRRLNETLLAKTEQRKLPPHELVEVRARLDPVVGRLPGFTQLGDFVEVYPTGAVLPIAPRAQRVLVDEAGTTAAVVTNSSQYDQLDHVLLITAFSNDHWIMTSKNFRLVTDGLDLPSEIDARDFEWEVPMGDLLATHRQRVAAVEEHIEEGYRSAAGSSNVILIRTLDDFLVDHRKRAELIRAKRKALVTRS